MPRTKSHVQRQAEFKKKYGRSISKRASRSVAKFEKSLNKARENSRAKRIANGKKR